MKLSPILLAVAVLVAGIFGFFIGKNTASSATSIASKTTSEKVAEKAKTVATTATTGIATTETPTSTTKEGEKEEIEPIKKTPELEETKTPTVATKNPTAEGDAVLKRMIKGISDQKLSLELETIAKDLEAQKLAYISSQGQDCSGIFHKIKDLIQKRIPALAQKADYQYPVYETVRSSRQIADWYFKNKNLLIVEDPVASRNSIRPGSVMFFGKSGKKFKNMSIEDLTDKNNNYTNNGHIMHIAVVTSVRTDEDGNVLEYTMMHGRNSKYHASRTGSKKVQSTRTKGLPAFGNWTQQWVAVANIATPT